LAGNPERWEGQKNRPFRIIEKKRRAVHDLISPGRTGWELAPAFPLRETGCCGFKGPKPSATLDKIPTKLSKIDCRGEIRPEQWDSGRNLEKNGKPTKMDLS
jgi:hypothetical protein